MNDALTGSTSTGSTATWVIVPSMTAETNDRWIRISRRLIAQLSPPSGMPNHSVAKTISLVETYDFGTTDKNRLPPSRSLVLWSVGRRDIVNTAEKLSTFFRSGRQFLHILAAPEIPLASVIELQRLGIHLWMRHPEDLAAMLPLIGRHFAR